MNTVKNETELDRFGILTDLPNPELFLNEFDGGELSVEIRVNPCPSVVDILWIQ